MRTASRARDTVFLNIPYDRKYEQLYLALISGFCAFGLTPRATLEVVRSRFRLELVYELMTSCRYSFHDLSRVELDHSAPRTPRFNMPFELGLIVGWTKANKSDHAWFVLEAAQYRLQKSLSDLNGVDPLIHGGTPRGVFRVLHSALRKVRYEPTVKQMEIIYNDLRRAAPLMQQMKGGSSLFEPGVFHMLVVLATEYAQLTIPRR